MTAGALVTALTLTAGSVLSSIEPEVRLFGQGQAAWSTTQTRHFEIHHLPGVTAELDRVIRVAEQAYRRLSGRLGFVLPSRVPVVLFAPSGPLGREQVVAYARSDAVAPPQPHRSRIVLPLSARDAQLDALLVHELTHLLVSEIILPGRGGDGGVPRWVQEGIASYMVGAWPDDYERLMREVVASGDVPALSELTGSGRFANVRLKDAIGHVAFEYIEGRWGPTSIRRFLSALIVPRVGRTYDAVFELTPAQFDAAFRQYTERRFSTVRC